MGYERWLVYSEAKAIESVIKKLESLSKDTLLKKIFFTAEAVGLENIIEFMCCYGGPMYIHYKKTGNYFIEVDTLRRCVLECKSKLKYQDSIAKTTYYNLNF